MFEPNRFAETRPTGRVFYLRIQRGNDRFVDYSGPIVCENRNLNAS